MATEPLPYYRWHWRDFRASRKVQRMNYIERGLYRELLDECWAVGYIPTDLTELADICNCPPDVLANAWQVLSKCFIERDGVLVNEKLDSLRTDMDKTRATRAAAGRAGALAKLESLANAKQMPDSYQQLPEALRQVPYSISSSISKEIAIAESPANAERPPEAMNAILEELKQKPKAVVVIDEQRAKKDAAYNEMVGDPAKHIRR